MTSKAQPIKKTSVGYIVAKQDGIEIFRTTNVAADHMGLYIQIRGHDIEDKNGFEVHINLDTPSGEQQFLPWQFLRVIYRKNWIDMNASQGTYNAYIEKGSRHIKLSFKLEFGNIGEIEGDVEVTV